MESSGLNSIDGFGEILSEFWFGDLSGFLWVSFSVVCEIVDGERGKAIVWRDKNMVLKMGSKIILLGCFKLCAS